MRNSSRRLDALDVTGIVLVGQYERKPMPADIDVKQAIDGVLQNGQPRPWAWVRGRARTVLGDVLKKKPFDRVVDGRRVAATPSQLDHDILTAEQVAWRYVDSYGNVWDLKDWMLVMIESFVATHTAAEITELREKASQLRPWPQGFPGRPDFE